ncbi:MAG: FHA domain-containing protein [Acidimicrobiales bacterium]|nr:FHA domain-containing protein [Acidimicrobiales bacterium]
MDEQLLTILKLCLLALLYLFFFRVLRAVWAEVRGPQLAAVAAPRQAARQAGREAKRVQRSAPPVQLAVVEPAAQKGRAYPLTEELTVGRAAGCGVTLDDTFASQIHARVFAQAGTFYVEDLGSTNGTYLNRQKVQGPQAMKRGDRLQVGNTVLELV